MKENKEKVYCVYCINNSARNEFCTPPTGETFSDYYSPNNTVYAGIMKKEERNKNNDCPYYVSEIPN